MARYTSKILNHCATWSIIGYDGHKRVTLPIFNKPKQEKAGLGYVELCDTHSLFEKIDM